ncbi:MAG TPA: SSI family serine proteinase inhibitor [Blastococcus sp.]|nr:SSI family serine proteinase inhibitor [Blastococcus sp.]
MRLILPLVALLALVTACASSPGGGTGAGTTSAGSSSAAQNDLLVEIHRGGGAATESYRLACGDTVTGNHPDGAAACAHLAAMKAPFAPIPADEMCSQIYSGPQTAHVTGTWKGRPVDLSLSRVDGCRTAQWNSLGPLLPGPVGMPTPR